jgi:3-oxoacyl-[acyl-carrier protein] reductase
MDLGISGRKAIVCAASKGLGKACALALAREGVHVTIAARTEGPLAETAEEIRGLAPDSDVRAVAADVTTDEGLADLLAACPEPDILVNNAGGPPPGDFRTWSRDDWHKAVDANMLAAIFLMKATVDGMMERRFGRIVNVTSSAVKAPIAILGLSNAARAGLTGFVAGLARETVQHNVTINNLLPGPFDTDRLASNIDARAKRAEVSADEMRQTMIANHAARRFGRPEEFGATCAFLCSAYAGYINAQNVLLDGGNYPGTF